MKLEFNVAKVEAGQTLASILRKRIADLAWSRARMLVETGKVWVDGQRLTDPTQRLEAGQAVKLDEAKPAPLPALRTPIVFEDSHVVVIDKPTGVSSVPYEKRESGTAMDLVRDEWRLKAAVARKGPARSLPVRHSAARGASHR